MVFPEYTSYRQKFTGILKIRDKIWAVGTDKKKLENVLLHISGTRIKEGLTIRDIITDVEPIEGTASFRLLAVKMQQIQVTVHKSIPVSVKVTGVDPFKLGHLLQDVYLLITGYPSRDISVRKGAVWGASGTGKGGGLKSRYWGEVRRTIRAVNGSEVIIFTTISKSGKSPVESRGFQLVSTGKGTGTSIVDMQTGKWRAADASYTFVVTGSRTIRGVYTTWVFKEEIGLKLDFE